MHGCAILTGSASGSTGPAAVTAARTKISLNTWARRCSDDKVYVGLWRERTRSAWTEGKVTWKGRYTEVHGGGAWYKQVR